MWGNSNYLLSEDVMYNIYILWLFQNGGDNGKLRIVNWSSTWCALDKASNNSIRNTCHMWWFYNQCEKITSSYSYQ